MLYLESNKDISHNFECTSMADQTPHSTHHEILGLADEDHTRYTLDRKEEIIPILRNLEEHDTLITAHFGLQGHFLLTFIVGLDAEGGWVFINAGANEDLNREILESPEIIFVTALNEVRIQFATDGVKRHRLEGRDTFRVPLPESLIKLQRREFFRIQTPMANPLRCIIPMKDGSTVEVGVEDISIGGVGIVFSPYNQVFEPGSIFNGCRINLPEIGLVTVALEVMDVFEASAANGELIKRAGCRFVGLPPNMQVLVQRYIIKIERERRAMQVDRQ